MSFEFFLLLLILAAGFYMAWSIGANDVANAMGTSVGSGALTLRQAVIIASILEFSGAFFFGAHVTETMQNGIVKADIFNNDWRLMVYGMLSALTAAGAWLQLASYKGWPVSTTHTIVGAVIGFGIVAGGWSAIQWGNIIYIVLSWIISPLLGGMLSYAIFNFLRKKILYTADPVRATKRYTPFLVFCVITIMSMIVTYKGLHNVTLSFLQALIISFCLAAVGFIVSTFLLKRIKVGSDPVKSHPVYGPEMALELDKAKKHLEIIYNATSGELNYQTEQVLEEIKNLSFSLKRTRNVESVEYASVEKIFGYLQMMSACLMAFAHGANDVANAIGPLAAAISALEFQTVKDSAPIPIWALGLGGIGIVIGLATWGWRVIETIGRKITELTPTRGFAAEFGAAITILFASRLGMPISTTHTLVGSVLGVGMARGIEALDLSMSRDIAISWLITVPAGAFLSIALFYTCLALFPS